MRVAEKALQANEQKVTAEYSIFKSMLFSGKCIKKLKINENFLEGVDPTNAIAKYHIHGQCGSRLNDFILDTPLYLHGHGCSSNMAIPAT